MKATSLGPHKARIVGHRGGAGEGWPPENTMPAFARALSEGAHSVECDVRLTRDGEAVVFHDATLERMTRGADVRAIAELTWDELAAVVVGGAGQKVRIPKLTEVVEFARDRALLHIELKSDVRSRWKLVQAVKRAIGDKPPACILSSFDPLLLGYAALVMRDVPRALLVDEDGTQSRLLPLLAGRVVERVHLERTQAAGDLLDQCLSRGLAVAVWTVDDPAEARAHLKRGVDAIISDKPGALRRALGI